ncbi:hypothetical protein EV193_104482 [Herbihabitans rhizosphaerae]|uniref:LVIVD repeat-containing protein n=1 Tax=Herbihabitans rhizosphaerae TaxID=1872711 RepID=A0A4Q7KRS2_9PSEU|nr:hypothetical protein [Herbihabitans rhizosphaerae]RZS39265.1 hypothetical protein EV193_104482 [Herbihabitans rhizosphaerae]
MKPFRAAMVAAFVGFVGLGGVGTAGAVQNPAPPPAPAPAEDKAPPPASANVRMVHQVPNTVGGLSFNFTTVGGRDVMLLSGETGLKSFDVSTPDKPVELDHVTNQELALPGDKPTADNFWENEDVEIDHKRKLVFMARERNALGVPPGPNRPTGVYILSFADPANLKVISWAPMGTGHTTSCVNDCRYLWTAGSDGGPVPPDIYQQTGKIFVTDIRDPAHPVTSDVYVDTNRNQGQPHMTHDVQVDAQGVAWVAGTGGTRGYWTDGLRWDPVQHRLRFATATHPVPFAGGASPKPDMPTAFSHNSFRPVGSTLHDGPIPSRQTPPGSLVLATEEAFSQTCQDKGRLVISSLRGSHDGDSWRATPEQPYYMDTVGIWSPHDQDGTGPIPKNACSAHYFDVKDRVVVQSYYMQGTRFIDVSDPRNPRQIAYWRPEGAQSFTPKWYKGFAFVADWTHGMQILQLTPGASTAMAAQEEVVLRLSPGQAKPVVAARDGDRPRVPVRPVVPDPVWGMACPMAGRPCEPGSLSCC